MRALFPWSVHKTAILLLPLVVLAPAAGWAAASEGGTTGPEPLEIAMGLTAGLVLFLYGVSRLALALKALATEPARRLLGRFTRNRFAGVLTGAAATTVLDSSSVTIIMVIALVDAGLLSAIQSLGVVLGSNIGTTFGAQLVAFQISKYAPVGLALGALLLAFGRSERWKHVGRMVFGMGLLFFGLELIEQTMEPFKDHAPFLRWMRELGANPLMGAAVGALFTLIIQSSSATMAIIVTLASQGLISLPTGVAIMLGAEIGTVADTLIATIGRSRQAIRTGVFHFLFNLITAVLGILCVSQLMSLAQWVSGGASVGRQIANAQVIFNVLGVLLFIGFVPLIDRALQVLLPDRRTDSASPSVLSREQNA
ncbi:Na/Pi cotransporter family protein [Cystobacter fuscus]|uniref:Na/Pi cotransporter family protein n=1 Tax=Cystobacter fuscus TaxID=43 RepID=UPI002B297E32|nr:Na/Pi cotransporter family protein [Cystobacter fuscus]